MTQVSPIPYPPSSTPLPSSFQSLILLNPPPSPPPPLLCPPYSIPPHSSSHSLNLLHLPPSPLPHSCTSFPQSSSTLIIPFSYPPLPTLTPVPPFPTPLPLSTPLPYSLLAHPSTLLPLIRILSSSILPYSSPHSYLFQRLKHTWQCLLYYMHSKVQESSVQF